VYAITKFINSSTYTRIKKSENLNVVFCGPVCCYECMIFDTVPYLFTECNSWIHLSNVNLLPNAARYGHTAQAVNG